MCCVLRRAMEVDSASGGKPGAPGFLGNSQLPMLVFKTGKYLGILWFLLLAEAGALTRNVGTRLFSFAALSGCFVS